MTQLELADKMGVTDKAVSKWERDLSCPDVNSIPKLAEIFEISVDELMQVRELPCLASVWFVWQLLPSHKNHNHEKFIAYLPMPCTFDPLPYVGS